MCKVKQLLRRDALPRHVEAGEGALAAQAQRLQRDALTSIPQHGPELPQGRLSRRIFEDIWVGGTASPPITIVGNGLHG